jgi:hypothetical protein
MKIKSKKAIEQPQFLIYTLFTTILTITGIYTGFMLFGDVDMKLEFSNYNLRYNAAAARILNDPDCFAYEQSYVDPNGKLHHQVEQLIDWQKLTQSNIPTSCIDREEQLYIKVTPLDTQHSTYDTELWSCKPRVRKVTTQKVEVKTASGDCSKPTFEDWPGKTINYPVILKHQTEEIPAVLSLRLDD